MLNFILDLLAKAGSKIIVVGGGELTVQHSVASVNGAPDNEVVVLSGPGFDSTWWTLKLTEAGIGNGTFDDSTELFLFTDSEGDPVLLRILLDEVVQRFHGGVTQKEDSVYVLVQEGGSSTEMYLHNHDTAAEADADRQQCWDDGAYRTSAVVEVPRSLADHPLFFDVVEKLLRASQDLSTGLAE